MKLMQEKGKGLLQYTWSWYNDAGEDVSPIFTTQDEALEWKEKFVAIVGKSSGGEGDEQRR